MKTVYLGDLRNQQKYEAVWWLTTQWPQNGPNSRWTLRELAYVDFVHEKDATFFLMMWA